jgi:hypothetical protein
MAWLISEGAEAMATEPCCLLCIVSLAYGNPCKDHAACALNIPSLALTATTLPALYYNVMLQYSCSTLIPSFLISTGGNVQLTHACVDAHRGPCKEYPSPHWLPPSLALTDPASTDPPSSILLLPHTLCFSFWHAGGHTRSMLPAPTGRLQLSTGLRQRHWHN